MENQLSLIPTEPPVASFEGHLPVADLVEKLENLHWFDVNGELRIKIITASFRESVSVYGILHPVLLTETEDRLFLGAGRGRLQAALDLHLETIPIRIFDGATVTADQLTLVENGQRTDNVLADYDSIMGLLESARERGLPVGEKVICEAVGMPVQTVRKRMQLANLLPKILDAFRSGKLTASVAEAAAKLDHGFQKQLLPVLEEKGRLTAEDVHAVKTVQSDAALFEIDEEAFATPGASDEPKDKPCFVVVITKIEDGTYMGVAGVFKKENDAKAEALDRGKTSTLYNYTVEPSTIQ